MFFKVLGGDLAKRLLGVGVIWPKDSLVLIRPWHQGVFWPDHNPLVKVPNFIKEGYDLAKRLLGVGVIWTKDSLVLTPKT